MGYAWRKPYLIVFDGVAFEQFRILKEPPQYNHRLPPFLCGLVVAIPACRNQSPSSSDSACVEDGQRRDETRLRNRFLFTQKSLTSLLAVLKIKRPVLSPPMIG